MYEVFGKTIYDSVDEIANPQHSALLLVDVCNDFYHKDGHFAKNGNDMSAMDAMIPHLSKLLDCCRAIQLPVIHIQNTVLSEGRSDSPPFIRFKARAVASLPVYTIEGTWGWEFLDGFAPRPGEIVVKKHRPSAFVSTDLDQVLRSGGIKSVIVTGCATEGCVQSTAVDAMFRDYYVVIPADCVATYSRELQEAALRYLALRTEVIDSDSVIAALNSHGREGAASAQSTRT